MSRKSDQAATTLNGSWTVMENKTTSRSEQLTSRFSRWRRNRVLIIFIVLSVVMLIVALTSGAALYYHYIPQTKKLTTLENPCDKLPCSHGSRCIVDERTQLPHCRCLEICSDVFAPVCGSDGVTYSSACQLRLSSCTQQRRIFVQRQGACDVKDPCKNKECQFGAICRHSLDGRGAECECPEKCFGESSSYHGSRPVCGSDGRNYPNLCEQKRASCREMRSIEMVFKGVCDPCEGVECPTFKVCQLDENRNPICRCNSICSPDFRPVCGSDGKTYTNECTLRVEACKSRKTIRIIYTGECSSGANPCDNLQCGPSQECDIDRDGIATCQCPITCEPVIRPVCGSDDLTYNNECELRRQACLTKKHITMVYTGECGARGPCYNIACSYGALCVSRGRHVTCECPTCAEEFEPVCGTDGISYTNKCKLKRDACEQKLEIAIAYGGLCNGCEKKRCEYYAVCESDGRGNGKCVCPQSCVKVDAKVCGSDKVTYENECEMRVAACKKAQYVLVRSKGPCDLCQNVHCKFGARCENGRCVCPTECLRTYEPVCANDGMTYQNECEMRHAACQHDQDLNMLFYGECDDLEGSGQATGSGLEGECDEKTCRYGGECDYDADGSSQCVCTNLCPSSLDPVCGSDGKLYDNECRLKEQSCRLQKNILPVHIEMCEEFPEVPCDGKTPLSDPSTGKDYFCGDGIDSKLCPPGSYCHKSSAFAKCCSEGRLIKSCSESIFGCCSDGKTPAQGRHNAGCPSICNCNKLGSYDSTCEPQSRQCTCKPGVGGSRCDRCEPGFWGLHKISDESSGCSPCTCNLYGSVRDDCEQMTGRCVCKQEIQGMKCDKCPIGTVLGPEGCMDASIAQPVTGSCQELVCFHGAQCKENEDQAQCICDFKCSPEDNQNLVCGSDGNTYGSECQMKLFSCRYQKVITAVTKSPCNPDMNPTVSPRSSIRRRSTFREALSIGESKNGFTQKKYKNEKLKKKGTLHRLKKNTTKSRPSPFPKPHGLPSLQWMKTMFTENSKIEICFRIFSRNGFLLYAENITKKETNFISLVIRNRYVEMRYKFGKKIKLIQSQVKLGYGESHQVLIKFNISHAALQVDGQWLARNNMSETPYGHHFLGFVSSKYQRIHNAAMVKKELSGCIWSIKIDGNKINFNHIPSNSIQKMFTLGKCNSSPCNVLPCRKSKDRLSFNPDFSEDECHPSRFSVSNSSSLKRRLYSKEHITNPNVEISESHELRDINITFRTKESSGVLFAGFPKSWSPLTCHLVLVLSDGRLHLRIFRRELANVTLRNETPVNDNAWHSVTVQRRTVVIVRFLPLKHWKMKRERKEKPRLAFGTTQERPLLPTKTPLSKIGAECYYKSPFEVGPGSYDIDKFTSFLHEQDKVTSTNRKGWGFANRNAPRIAKDYISIAPAPTAYQRDACLPRVTPFAHEPFGSKRKRFHGERLPCYLTPGPGNYQHDVEVGRRVRVQSSFGGKMTVIQPVTIKCVTEYEHKCDLCGEDTIGDYWEGDKQVVCRPCYEEYKIDPQRCGKLKGLGKVRDCSFMHDHKGTNRAVQLVSSKTLKTLQKKEAYLNLFFD